MKKILLVLAILAGLMGLAYVGLAVAQTNPNPVVLSCGDKAVSINLNQAMTLTTESRIQLYENGTCKKLLDQYLTLVAKPENPPSPAFVDDKNKVTWGDTDTRMFFSGSLFPEISSELGENPSQWTVVYWRMTLLVSSEGVYKNFYVAIAHHSNGAMVALKNVPIEKVRFIPATQNNIYENIYVQPTIRINKASSLYSTQEVTLTVGGPLRKLYFNGTADFAEYISAEVYTYPTKVGIKPMFVEGDKKTPLEYDTSFMSAASSYPYLESELGDLSQWTIIFFYGKSSNSNIYYTVAVASKFEGNEHKLVLVKGLRNEDIKIKYYNGKFVRPTDPFGFSY